jgi:hypothetical protein
MAKKIKQNPEYKKFLVTIFDKENNSLDTYQVRDMFNNDLEYDDGILPVNDAVQYFDHTSGGLHFFYQLDLPAKVEAQNLKMLRRDKAIANIFTFDINKQFDVMKFLPWVAIILLILFK